MQTYLMGATNVVVATGFSNVVECNLSRGANGVAIKIGTGAGTLSIVTKGFSATQGYAIGASEVFVINGPALFYLAAASATMTAQMAISYSAGYSLGNIP